MSPTLRIGSRTIGAEHPALIIAEIGVNHDGQVERALQLVQIASRAGADAIKLQLFKAERLMNRSAEFATYQKSRVHAADPIEMLRQYELSRDAAGRIVNAARDLSLIALATPFSPEDVDDIAALDLPAVKIAAPDLVNLVLLRRVLQLNRPMLLSTGAATMEEVQRTVEWLRDRPGDDGCGCHSDDLASLARAGSPCHEEREFALLHCISAYPTPDDQAHLKWIGELSTATGAVIGYSDHTTSTFSGALAVSAGARIVEKHLTYDMRAAGPDHSASLDEAGFTQFVRSIREAEQMLGRGPKHVLEIEQDVRRVSRQSLVARREIPVGKIVEAADLTVQRPARGIPASNIDAAIGSQAATDIPAGTMIQWNMLHQK